MPARRRLGFPLHPNVCGLALRRMRASHGGSRRSDEARDSPDVITRITSSIPFDRRPARFCRGIGVLVTDGLGPVRPCALGAGCPMRRRYRSRCEAVFKTRTFSISGVGNFYDVIGVDPSPGGTCSTCHNQVAAGNSPSLNGPAIDRSLPVFPLTCTSGSTAYPAAVATANDPGRALITGRCSDIGGFHAGCTGRSLQQAVRDRAFERRAHRPRELPRHDLMAHRGAESGARTATA